MEQELLFTGPNCSATFQDYPERTQGQGQYSMPRPQCSEYAQDVPQQLGVQFCIPHRRECRIWAGFRYVRSSVRRGSATVQPNQATKCKAMKQDTP